MTEKKYERAASSWAGLSVIGAGVTGVLAVAAGLMAILSSSDYGAGGINFLAAALAFSLLANAIFRR